MQIIPYVMVNGSRTLPDHVMKDVYYSMKRYELDRMVFPGEKINNVNDFLALLQNPGNVVTTVWEDNNQQIPKIQAIFWLNSFGINYAFGHFCCWPETWGKTSISIGREILKNWFSFKDDKGNHLLDVILGFIPIKNKFAIQYIKKVGMTVAAEIPDIKLAGDSEGVVLSYIKRSEV